MHEVMDWAYWACRAEPPATGDQMKRIAALGAVALLAVACSSPARKGSPAAANTARSSSSATAAPFRPATGQDAALIASHIPGCAGLAAGSVEPRRPRHDLDRYVHAARPPLILDSFTAANATAALPPLLKDNKTPTFYADGGSWIAFTADQGATPEQTTLQMQLTNDAAGLLRQSIDHSQSPPTASDAQQAIAAAVVAALGGKVASAP